MTKTIKPALTLCLLTVVIALLLALLYDLTREPIQRQHAQRERDTIALLLPGTAEIQERYINDYTAVTKIVTGLDTQGLVTGYVVSATTPGYSGPVEIMAGFNNSGLLTGVQIVRQSETPGLGTAILNPAFLQQFEGQTGPLTVTRIRGENRPGEIDALVSATVSTEAVVRGVNAALLWMSNYKE